ncbi:MAG: hypothetical protein DYG89_34935 [Caldilinea sp. CFX5]|nr:hypothetical protein [Caldilinea sp. CFX5]
MNNQTWQPFSLPPLPFRFHYPPTTAQGQPVAMDELRLHFRAIDSNDVYFELSRHLYLSAQEVYDREKRFAEERLEAVVSELKPSTFAGQPAYEFRFRWADGERVVVLIEKDAILYRLIYDPQAALNGEILQSFEFV